MGTLERIRSVSPYFLALFAILFVGFMVISDLDFGTLMRQGDNYQTAVLATINGDEILYKDFEEKVREQVEQRRAQMGENETEINEEQIRLQVWDQMINEILVKQEADKIGLHVSNAELLDIMLENPPDYLQNAFKDSAGNFQRQFYLDVVTNPDGIYSRLPQSMSEQEKRDYINNWKKDLLRIQNEILKQKLYESLAGVVNTSNGFVSPNFAEQKFVDEKGTASAIYILIEYKKNSR
jgi:peptidyl-prolyl cis-trans isomerase D